MSAWESLWVVLGISIYFDLGAIPGTAPGLLVAQLRETVWVARD